MTSPTDRQILEHANRWYRGGGAREQAIRDELDMGAVAFWARVVRIVADPPLDLAVDYGPTILRLRRRLDVGVRRRVA